MADRRFTVWGVVRILARHRRYRWWLALLMTISLHACTVLYDIAAIVVHAPRTPWLVTGALLSAINYCLCGLSAPTLRAGTNLPLRVHTELVVLFCVWQITVQMAAGILCAGRQPVAGGILLLVVTAAGSDSWIGAVVLGLVRARRRSRAAADTEP